jgi:hypothetical protein
MKKTIVSTNRLMFMAISMMITIAANAMSYKEAKNEALYLSDKMAYEPLQRTSKGISAMGFSFLRPPYRIITSDSIGFLYPPKKLRLRNIFYHFQE